LATAVGLVIIGLVVFVMSDLGSGISLFDSGSGSGSGVNFTDNRVQSSHHNLSFEIPDTIHPRLVSNNRVLALPFDGDREDVWVLVFQPAQNMTEDALEDFKNSYLTNHQSQRPFGASERIIINDTTAFIKEARHNSRGGRDIFAFIYANSEIYVFQYHAIDRHFDTYLPYFIDILESIRW